MTRTENGWSARMFRENAFRGEVVFDKESKVVSMTKMYLGPLPSGVYSREPIAGDRFSMPRQTYG